MQKEILKKLSIKWSCISGYSNQIIEVKNEMLDDLLESYNEKYILEQEKLLEEDNEGFEFDLDF